MIESSQQIPNEASQPSSKERLRGPFDPNAYRNFHTSDREFGIPGIQNRDTESRQRSTITEQEAKAYLGSGVSSVDLSTSPNPDGSVNATIFLNSDDAHAELGVPQIAFIFWREKNGKLMGLPREQYKTRL